jgi:hypothetical protein
VANEDAMAAYTQALLWNYTGDKAYATRAIAILNAWSAQLVAVDYTSGEANTSNGPLVAAWLGEVFPRAGELLRYSGSGWAAADINRFSRMLASFLPLTRNGWPWSNGNWSLSMADATLSIGVFNDDKAAYDAGVALWRSVTPTVIYDTSDGAYPRSPPGGKYPTAAKVDALWNTTTGNKSSKYVNGRLQETCRDFVHLALEVGSMVNSAETARIQGLDLYSEQKTRMANAFELHAKILNDNARGDRTLYASVCGSGMKPPMDTPTWEIGYNGLSRRLGISMPNTAALLTRIRPVGVKTSASHQMAWETLTHSGVGSAGLP